MAEEACKAVREGRQAGWGGWARLAWVASRVGWHLRGKIAFLKAGFSQQLWNGTGHTTRAPPVGFELETNGIQFYASLIANKDKT